MSPLKQRINKILKFMKEIQYVIYAVVMPKTGEVIREFDNEQDAKAYVVRYPSFIIEKKEIKIP